MNIMSFMIEAATDTKRLRTLQRENNEFQIRVVGMLSELDELRASKETIRVEYEQQERLHQRRLMDEISNAKQVQADKDAFASQVLLLQQELRDVHTTNDRVQEENSRISRECNRVSSKLEESGHKFT